MLPPIHLPLVPHCPYTLCITSVLLVSNHFAKSTSVLDETIHPKSEYVNPQRSCTVSSKRHTLYMYIPCELIVNQLFLIQKPPSHCLSVLYTWKVGLSLISVINSLIKVIMKIHKWVSWYNAYPHMQDTCAITPEVKLEWSMWLNYYFKPVEWYFTEILKISWLKRVNQSKGWQRMIPWSFL